MDNDRLFFLWNYANQPGVPWKSITGNGSNEGSNTRYQYTDAQLFDIAPGNPYIEVGDVIELVVLASGCSLNGHDGHLYLDNVTTGVPGKLFISATGPQSSPLCNDITYTYTYSNPSKTAISNVEIVANMPQQGTPNPPPAKSTTFVSVTTPTAGTAPSCVGGPVGSTTPVTCNIGTLQPGEIGTFQLAVRVPASWPISTGPVNNGNYVIVGDNVLPVLGPLIQTQLVESSDASNLVINATGLPTTANLCAPYVGTYTCSNVQDRCSTADAPHASCNIAKLPPGIKLVGCTISPLNLPWSEPADIPLNQTVTCTVAGTVITPGVYQTKLSTDAVNNSNSMTNRTSVTISTTGSCQNIPATWNGLPLVSPATVFCGRPILLGPLPIPGPGSTSYLVTEHTGNLSCVIGQSGTQTYLKVNGSGSCTIVAFKGGIRSAPFVVIVP